MQNTSRDSLYQWYAVKPLAAKIFKEYAFEIYWIKNAWICFYEGIEDETLKISITIDDPKNEINDEIRVWLIALYKLYHQFKKAVGLEYEDTIDENGIAYDIDFDIKSYYETQLRQQDRDKKWTNEEIDHLIWEDLNKKEETFKGVINKKFNNDPLKIVEFLCNTEEVLDLVSYFKANEDQCNSLEDFFEIEETEYPEYENKVEAKPVYVNDAETAEMCSWVEENFNTRIAKRHQDAKLKK